MRLECGQVTKLMKNRPAVNTALLFSTCLHMSGDHTVTTPTPLRIHKGLDGVLPMNIEGKWNQLAPYTGLFSGKGTNTQKQRIRNFSDDNHTLVIISSLCGSTCCGHKDPDPRSSIR